MDDLIAERFAQLERRLARLEGESAVRKLQHTYGYYLDKQLYDHIIELFSRDSELCMIGAIYRGKTGVARFFNELSVQLTQSRNRPIHGVLSEHMIFQGVITVADDAMSAKGRFRLLSQTGTHETVAEKRPPQQEWAGGIYENEYIKEDGIWKISLLEFRMVYAAPYHLGWSVTDPTPIRPIELYPKNPYGPDAFSTQPNKILPNVEVMRFHYKHPVTGATIPHDA